MLWRDLNLLAKWRSVRAGNCFLAATISSISHELRTPLNGVLGYAQLLLADAHGSGPAV